MKRLWLWMWLAVIVGQLGSLWVVKRFFPPYEPVLNVAEPALFELARATAAAWPQMEPVSHEPMIEADADPILARENWLMQIRDVEQTARKRGMDIRISDELQAWLHGSRNGASETKELTHQLAYLMNVRAWLTTWLSGVADPSQQRLSLNPDPDSQYPSLHFELEGDPGVMGLRLHQCILETLSWHMQELELIHQHDAGLWRLRGNCAFRRQVRR